MELAFIFLMKRSLLWINSFVSSLVYFILWKLRNTKLGNLFWILRTDSNEGIGVLFLKDVIGNDGRTGHFSRVNALRDNVHALKEVENKLFVNLRALRNFLNGLFVNFDGLKKNLSGLFVNFCRLLINLSVQLWMTGISFSITALSLWFLPC